MDYIVDSRVHNTQQSKNNGGTKPKLLIRTRLQNLRGHICTEQRQHSPGEALLKLISCGQTNKQTVHKLEILICYILLLSFRSFAWYQSKHACTWAHGLDRP